MSAPIDDGGPTGATLHNGDVKITPSGGLSIRDYFAGQALIGILAQPLDAGCIFSECATAVSAYCFADAMIAARKGGPQS